MDRLAAEKLSPADRLRQRLQQANTYLKTKDTGSAQKEKKPSRHQGATAVELEQILGVRVEETEIGDAFVKEERLPLTERHGEVAVRSPLDLSDAAYKTTFGGGGPVRQSPDRRGLVFLDLETTGLSGGTGTYIFLAGLAYYTESELVVRQFFLASLAGEAAMLQAITRNLDGCTGIVTYNGRSFDIPCLQSRLTMSRLRYPSGGVPDLDLLYVVRRLFGHRMPSCRLGDAEIHLLGFERRNDVPGWQVPALYFDYLRAGRIAPLRGVFHHNLLDLVSTGTLLGHAGRLFEPGQLAPEDALSVARWWEWAQEPCRAMELYGSALPELEEQPAWRWAAPRQALLLKRAGRRNDAFPIWRRLWNDGDVHAGLELAKHLEHHARDVAGATEVTRRLLATADARRRPELEHRLARLERKRARGAAGNGS